VKRKREILNRYSWIIKLVLKFSKLLPKRFYIILYKIIMPHNNFFAIFIRYICLKNVAKRCGDNVAVFPNVYIFNFDMLIIGNNVSIHPMCYIQASGGITIGNDVSIAHGTTILSEEHIFSDVDTNIKDQGRKYEKTKIENNVWIAAGCRILAGTTIGTGSVVAAGAVTKGQIKSNVIIGGVPAKVIRERKKE